MPYIPETVATTELSEKLVHYLGSPRRGKVRDTYQLPGYDGILLPVASDRVSIFDFVLGSLIPDKGAVLTALTIMWLTVARILKDTPHHLLAFGRGIDEYLPPDLRGNTELQKRALVVQKLDMLPVECVVRGYLTGSGWSAYQKHDGVVCGHQLSPGLHDGAKLPRPLFTPTTKAEEGHDEHLPFQEVLARYGRQAELKSLSIFTAAARFAEHRGILLADTKFEFGQSGGTYVLGDEVLTPDSSRFWLAKDWEKAVLQRKSPAGYDKQPVREWGKGVNTPFPHPEHASVLITGINNLSPADPEHQRFVGSVPVPVEVANPTTRRYREALKMLASMPLGTFLDSVMHVR